MYDVNSATGQNLSPLPAEAVTIIPASVEIQDLVTTRDSNDRKPVGVEEIHDRGFENVGPLQTFTHSTHPPQSLRQHQSNFLISRSSEKASDVRKPCHYRSEFEESRIKGTN